MVKAYFLRRRKLGKTSTEGIRQKSKQVVSVFRNDWPALGGVAKELWCIRWGCTSNSTSKNVLNTAEAIHWVNDKRESRLLFSEKELAPQSWGDLAAWQADDAPLPIIIRPKRHAQGRKLFFCNTLQQAKDAIAKIAGRYYISVFVDKVAEYRVFILQGRAVWVAKKTPANPKDIAWNVARGGRFDNVSWSDWPLKSVKTAIEAFNLTKLDFGGVDVMVDKEGNCFVLEINSAPSQTSEYRQSCCAKAFDYLLEKENKNRIPLVDKKGGYLKFIHPALDEKAY